MIPKIDSKVMENLSRNSFESWSRFEAQKRACQVHCPTTNSKQTGEFWVFWRKTGRGQMASHAWRPCLKTRGQRIKLNDNTVAKAKSIILHRCHACFVLWPRRSPKLAFTRIFQCGCHEYSPHSNYQPMASQDRSTLAWRPKTKQSLSDLISCRACV